MDDHQPTSFCGSVLLNRLANIFVRPQNAVFDKIIFSHSHGKAKTLKQSGYHLYKEFMNPLLKQPFVGAAVKFPRAKDIQRATRRSRRPNLSFSLRSGSLDVRICPCEMAAPSPKMFTELAEVSPLAGKNPFVTL